MIGKVAMCVALFSLGLAWAGYQSGQASPAPMVVYVPDPHGDTLCTFQAVAMQYDYSTTPRTIRFTPAPGAAGRLYCPVVFRDGFE